MHHQFSLFNSWRWIQECFERDNDRLILWWPVVFGLGILGYFSLYNQPSTENVTLVFSVASLFLFLRRYARLYLITVGIFAFTAGFTLTHLRTIILDTHLISEKIKDFSFQAVVKDVEETQRGQRLLLELQNREDSLKSIRVSLKPDLPLPAIGQEIEGMATLLPFGGIVSESAYNFRRTAYFQGINATGQLLRYKENFVPEDWKTGIKAFRKTITDKIKQQFQQETDVGGIIAALVTGTRGGIADATRQSFTDAGLAHLLAISGLHLSLIAGFIFLLIRRGFSLSMFLAETYDLKKVAAVLTIPFLVFYLMISGMGIPALRAFLMILLAMVAILVDRNPLSMRLVCFAASLILLIYPESLLSASFQLSFAAVTALIGVYEGGFQPFKEWANQGGWVRKIFLYLMGVIATTLIASFATTLFTIAIFQRFSLQGLLGNLIAIPLTGFVIMPLIVVFLLLMPFGGEFLIAPFLKVSIELLIYMAGWVADLPGAAILVPEQPLAFIAFFTIGGIWFSLWQQRWRYLGIIPLLGSLLFFKVMADPKIVLPEREQAIYGFDGAQAFCIGCRESGFMREMFLRQVGKKDLKQQEQQTVTLSLENVQVFLTVEKQAKQELQKACQQSDYLFSSRSLWSGCKEKEKLIDWYHIKKQGTTLIKFKDGVAFVTSSCKLQGCRPWSEAKCCS